MRTVDDLRARLADLGARPPHVPRILGAWLAGRALNDIPARRAGRLSAALADALPSLRIELHALAVEIAREPAADGSCRRLARLPSGRTIESVDLPRAGLCVSTQVGCAVRCRFCKTGEDGLLANLSALEILAQVVASRRERAVRRVVFMGMGEPSHNLDAVLDATTALGTEGRIAHKNVVLSTVGEPRVFDRLLAHPVRPALALSLHTLDAALRTELLPHAPRIAPRSLLESALGYADRTTYPLLVQWTLLDGVNDSIEEARRLGASLAGRRAIVNYIPFNSVEGNGFRRPPIERCVELVRAVKAAGAMSTLRMSAGQEVDAGCGQLRARRTALSERLSIRTTGA
jgi:23S rRNA (adenine2503-C2)-methyltransferase